MVKNELSALAAKIDHTNLKINATWEDIRKTCDEAMAGGAASVCIPPCYVKKASEYLENSSVKVCTVIGFPNGYNSTDAKVFETKVAIIDGAREIDMVINVGFLKDKNYDAVLDEIVKIKEACNEFEEAYGEIILKVIIETCLLTEDEKIKMCNIVSQSGADFIKTSTGFSKAGATREDVILMKENVQPHVRVKAAGGIKSVDDMNNFLALGADRLGSSSAIKLLKPLM